MSAEPTPSNSSSATSRWQATALTAPELVQGAKSPSGKLAKSDTKLLENKSPDLVNVVVKLDYDAIAAYKGGVNGLEATSPSATKKKLDPDGAAAKKYEKYIEGVENAFLSALGQRIPEAKVGQKLRLVLGGISLRLPGNKAAELLKLPGVAAVQEDSAERPNTDSSAAFIGANTIYNQLGGSSSSGKGVIVGILDSGAWPEQAQFADPGNLPAPPAKADGTPRTCDFGDNPLTPATDVFVCNNKVIGGQPFLDTYNIIVGGEVFPDSARDSNGHGTHTATTSAGGPASGANPLGINRGNIHGIAPAAHVSIYKVCGLEGCYQSDSAAAVAQAIRDGVRVINFSISGGNDPYSDPVELAFLDAYAAGVFVAASAGNSGPGPNTVAHRSPWVTTVAASTQSRTFQSTITLAGAGGASATIKGASITAGVASPLPVVLASAPPYNNALCTSPAPPGIFTGKIVACERGPGRVVKGFNVRQGGAAGMLLYNGTAADVMTDNHWLPTVHLDKPEGDTLRTFLANNPGATAKFTQGTATTWQGDVITTFSSRGPGGDFLKPDVTAPGLHILAGNTPVLEDAAGGPQGQYYQAIAGTSMSSPHVAGAAALVFALNPTFTPGQVKSALETTGKTAGVFKQDKVTPADPFDFGGGRINLGLAGKPGVTFDETAANFVASANDPQNRIDLNLPSINAPVMPGVITTTRVAKNVASTRVGYRVSGVAPSGASITVTPSSFNIVPGDTVALNIKIDAGSLPEGQYFGQIKLDTEGGGPDLRLPVAFYRQQGIIPVTQTCAPTTIAVTTGRSSCSVTIQNNTLASAQVTSRTGTARSLDIQDVVGATRDPQNPWGIVAQKTLAGRQPDRPVIAPGASPAGFIPLSAFGITPVPIGDEQALNFTVPSYRFAGRNYTRIGITSNGYSIAGGSSGTADIEYVPQSLPNPTPPNNVLAPFWTDLDGSDALGIYAATLTDGVDDWLVIEWRVNVYGTSSQRVFQQWIGLNGTEDITYTYDPANLPAAPPAGYGLTVGAENADGSAGSQIAGLPTQDLRVTSTPGAPGETMTYTFKIMGLYLGRYDVTTSMSTPLVRGDTVDVDKITVQ
ncbi:S8 family serine peptidase [Rhizohabitans arisaemae]|uniref:S8 family serine peptidase n=1 Tax=Rhizohabitans arisaemae TaxID=2720610 RepID=UPI0024B27FA2|nr:S8 family serine peptidase [Rhizohabitans arisaemae]